MPRPGLPPTPASSTDIRAKDNKVLSSSLEMIFTLPPPAIAPAGKTSSTPSVNSDSSYHPVSPTSPHSRAPAPKHKRTASKDRTRAAHADFSLPPPPTRSRKIIQMRPHLPNNPSTASAPPSSKTDKKPGMPAPPTSAKKPPSSTSVAGKKIARKTAHSLIERRRRSKMNEEFAVLKEMIPACRDQEMHKLAILQASIEYLRYLEQCVADLKVAAQSGYAHYQSQAPTPRPLSPMSPPNVGQDIDEDEDDEDEDDDLEMEDLASADTSPAIRPFGSISASPAMMPDRRHHGSSYSSTASSLPSPAFPPQAYPYHHPYPDLYPAGYAHSTTVSPRTMPDAADHEATAALLMLNTDRRHSGGGKDGKDGARGMSVQDLLSS